jgi:hypothetical protein
LRLYRSLVLTVLLYGCESWPMTPPNLHRLEVFHQRRLREILRMKWENASPTRRPSAWRALDRGHAPQGAPLLARRHRMADERTVKRLLFGQINRTRPLGDVPKTLRRTFEADVRVLQGGVPNGVVRGGAGPRALARHGGQGDLGPPRRQGGDGAGRHRRRRLRCLPKQKYYDRETR